MAVYCIGQKFCGSGLEKIAQKTVRQKSSTKFHWEEAILIYC